MENTVIKLILSLSKQEKDYFSKYSKVNKKKTNNNYLSIYNHIINSGDFNISKIKEDNDESLLKHSSIKKEKLLEKILLSSINFNFDKDFTWNLIKDILMIKVLIEKGLTEKANKFIFRAKKNAYFYQEFNLLLNIIEIEESLCFNRCFVINYTRLSELQKERQEINEIIENINDLLKIKAEVQQYQFEENYYTSKLENFIKKYEHNPLIPENEIKSIKAHLIWLYINYVICFIINDYKNGYIYIRKQYEIYHSRPELFSKDEYFQLMNNYLFFCCLNKNEEDFNKILNELIETRNISKEEDFFIKKIKFFRTLEMFHQIEKYKEAEKLAFESEEFLEIINPLVETHLNRYLQMLIIRAFVESKNYEAAIHLSHKHFKTIGFDFDSSMFKIFEFIAHYKLKNFENLYYSVNSWAKTIRSKRKQFPIEKVLIKFFRSVCNKATLDEKKQLISNTIVQIKQIEQSNLKFYLNHVFDFTEWFERELEEMK